MSVGLGRNHLKQILQDLNRASSNDEARIINGTVGFIRQWDVDIGDK
jgi:hypothetical protein